MNVNQEYQKLTQELETCFEQLSFTGAGASVIERTLMPPHINKEIERQEKTVGKDGIRLMCIKTAARYLVLIKCHPTVFHFGVENQTTRALRNNNIDDNALWYWCNFPRNDWLNEEKRKYPIPSDLKNELNLVLRNYPELTKTYKITTE